MYICYIKNHHTMKNSAWFIHWFARNYSSICRNRGIVEKTVMLFFAALFSGFSMFGQTISELGYFQSINGDNALVQHFVSGTDTNAVIYCKDGSTHYIIGTSNSYNYRYTLPQPIVEFGQFPCEINDMVLVGKTLFLCGSMTEISEEDSYYTMDGHYLPVYDTFGFLMTVDVTDVVNPSSPNIRAKYKGFRGMSEFNQIAVQLAGSDTLIGMVGTCNDISCLVCLTMTGPGVSPIMKKYAMPDTTEVLTDLVFTGKSFVTVSRFGGEAYTFGVRFADIWGLFYNYDLSNYSQLTKFDTERMICGNDANTWHKNDVTIRLVDVGMGSEVVVAYDSRYYFTSGHYTFFSGYVPFFYVDGNDMWHPVLRGAKSLHGVPDTLEVFRDMKYNADDNSIAILRRSILDNYASSVTLFPWSASSAREIYSISEDMSSFDILGNNLIAVANLVDNNSLERLWKDTRYVTVSCFSESEGSFCTYNVLPGPEYSTTELSTTEISVFPRYSCDVKGKEIRYAMKCTRDIEDALNIK